MYMDFSLVDYLLSISGFIIITLLSGIAYFLRQFAISVTDLKSTVEDLRIMLSVEQEKVKNTRDTLDSNIKDLYNTMDTIIVKVDIIDKEVAVLKALQRNK